MTNYTSTYKFVSKEYLLSTQSMSENQNQRYGAIRVASVLHAKAGLPNKNKTLLGNFKFEYFLTKDDIRRRKLVKNQVMIFASSSMPAVYYSMRAEQRCYGHRKQVMPVVYERFQAVATGRNVMASVFFL